MTDESCVAIEVTKEIPFFGEGDTLESRLRQVSLRGFPHIQIYENSSFTLDDLTPQQIPATLYTPQARVYQTHLDRIGKLQELFLREGIDILQLVAGYDFTATSESGEQSEWTMIPPVVENFRIPRSEKGKLDYTSIIGKELQEKLDSMNLGLNPAALNLPHKNSLGYFNLINDGSHRIHYGLQNGGVTVITAHNITPGFPYYAAPQEYDRIQVFPERTEALEKLETKIHIVESPGHKELYRLFPSGGIKSGEIRHDPKIHRKKN